MATERSRAPHPERRRRRGRDRDRRRRSHALRDPRDRSASPPTFAPRRSRGRSRSRSRTRSRSRDRSSRRHRPSSRDTAVDDRRDRHRRESANSMSFHHESNEQHRAREEDAVAVASHGSGGPDERRDDGPRRRDRSRGRGGRHGGAPRRSKLSVPDNWDDVPKIGALVASSRFVAMRVPLDDKFTRMIRSPDEVWTPEIFLQTQARVGHDVRLLIDLTNTTKYYDGEAEFHDSGVKYVKLCIEGFKAPPRETEVEAFVRIVDDFVAMEPHGSIAVHCTHGLNRTGYLVVSYLVRRSGMSVQDALKAFSDARPPGLIKHMYIEDLFRRFAPDASIELPELPGWASAKYAARRR